MMLLLSHGVRQTEDSCQTDRQLNNKDMMAPFGGDVVSFTATLNKLLWINYVIITVMDVTRC